MKKLIECVPNFSEGRDLAVIEQITREIENTEGVTLLDVDPGASTHRTVVTFVGEPDEVIEAAFLAIKKASELIDMREHSGAHPRMGATDVCPLIPISGITDEEAIEYAHRLAKRVGEELSIGCYLYEKAATRPERKNLAIIREGEYEAFAEKILDPEWKPDYGPAKFNARTGHTVIGVRDFLIAYNVNLNSTSVRRANNVAYDIREKGRAKTDDGTPTGKKVKDANGNTVMLPGTCKGVKAIGWFVEEYGIAQISMNITDLKATPFHKAFQECVDSAHRRGMRVTGSEVVGLLPKACLLDAARFFLRRQNRSEGISEEELIQLAIKSMGLDEVAPFDPREKIIEYAIEAQSGKKLIDLNLREFNNLTASESAAPGGGSVAALVGALGASLGSMVANLSANKRGWDDQALEFGEWAAKGQALKDELLRLVDEDTNSFNRVMEAMRLPRGTEAEKTARLEAIETANKGAAQVPFTVMETAFKAYELVATMAKIGNPNSITDAGVGALCLHTCVVGAGLNVRINLGDVQDQQFVQDLKSRVIDLIHRSEAEKDEIMAEVEAKI